MTIWEQTRGKGWLVMLSWISHLRSIMFTRDLIGYIYCVFLGQANNLWQALTNGCTAALVMLWEIARGKCLLVMLSWISHLRSIIVTRD